MKAITSTASVKLYQKPVMSAKAPAKPGAILVKSIGMNINACAKMMGITFAAFIFRGMY